MCDYVVARFGSFFLFLCHSMQYRTGWLKYISQIACWKTTYSSNPVGGWILRNYCSWCSKPVKMLLECSGVMYLNFKQVLWEIYFNKEADLLVSVWHALSIKSNQHLFHPFCNVLPLNTNNCGMYFFWTPTSKNCIILCIFKNPLLNLRSPLRSWTKKHIHL